MVPLVPQTVKIPFILAVGAALLFTTTESDTEQLPLLTVTIYFPSLVTFKEFDKVGLGKVFQLKLVPPVLVATSVAVFTLQSVKELFNTAFPL